MSLRDESTERGKELCVESVTETTSNWLQDGVRRVFHCLPIGCWLMGKRQLNVRYSLQKSRSMVTLRTTHLTGSCMQQVDVFLRVARGTGYSAEGGGYRWFMSRFRFSFKSLHKRKLKVVQTLCRAPCVFWGCGTLMSKWWEALVTKKACETRQA